MVYTLNLNKRKKIVSNILLQGYQKLWTGSNIKFFLWLLLWLVTMVTTFITTMVLYVICQSSSKLVDKLKPYKYLNVNWMKNLT